MVFKSFVLIMTVPSIIFDLIVMVKSFYDIYVYKKDKKEDIDKKKDKTETGSNNGKMIQKSKTKVANFLAVGSNNAKMVQELITEVSKFNDRLKSEINQDD